MRVCMYLRKSRKDKELEERYGDMETLAKHKKALLNVAKQQRLSVVDIKNEIESGGEDIESRPRMQELLNEIPLKIFEGVLVMDIDRLGRGKLKDQGTVLDAFKKNNILIVTPDKIYDLNDEQDEEIVEFKAFFSRKELRMINKRMQNGRLRSAEEGNYMNSRRPFGYDFSYEGRQRTLVINQAEAEIIRLIFKLYLEGNGTYRINKHLLSVGAEVNRCEIAYILKNTLYIGMVKWKGVEVPGKHEPIIDKETFYKAQIVSKEKLNAPIRLDRKPRNPFAGIVRCKKCGAIMCLVQDKSGYRLACNVRCGNGSVYLARFEERVLKELREYLDKYKFEVKIASENNKPKAQLKQLEKELKQLKDQREKLFDFLERGIYSEEVFLERSTKLDKRIENIENAKKKIKIIKENKALEKVYENALDAYEASNDITHKNMLLKTILYKIEYEKEKGRKIRDFSVTIYPKLL